MLFTVLVVGLGSMVHWVLVKRHRNALELLSSRIGRTQHPWTGKAGMSSFSCGPGRRIERPVTLRGVRSYVDTVDESLSAG